MESAALEVEEEDEERRWSSSSLKKKKPLLTLEIKSLENTQKTKKISKLNKEINIQYKKETLHFS